MDYIIELTRQYGALVPGIILILDSSTPFGILMPGFWCSIAAGFLSQLGIIESNFALASVFFGTLIGDFLGYAIGYWLDVNMFHKKDIISRKAIENHSKYMFLIVMFSRFIPVAKSIFPNLFGVLRIRRTIFIPATILGAVVWNYFYFQLGFHVGYQVLEFVRYFNLSLIISTVIILIALYKIVGKVNKKYYKKNVS